MYVVMVRVSELLGSCSNKGRFRDIGRVMTQLGLGLYFDPSSLPTITLTPKVALTPLTLTQQTR